MDTDDRRRSPPGIVWSWLTARSALWAVASGLRGPRTFAGLNRSMYRITCPSRARLHARSQVLAHASWPDIPDNRPLSDRFGGRSLFPEIEQQLGAKQSR